MLGFPGEASELATPVRIPAADLGLVAVRWEHARFGAVLLGDHARRRPHPIVKFGAELGPAFVTPPTSRRRVILL
jgi:hypothetical protein